MTNQTEAQKLIHRMMIDNMIAHDRRLSAPGMPNSAWVAVLVMIGAQCAILATLAWSVM